jgi:hypothetical protein
MAADWVKVDLGSVPSINSIFGWALCKEVKAKNSFVPSAISLG